MVDHPADTTSARRLDVGVAADVLHRRRRPGRVHRCPRAGARGGVGRGLAVERDLAAHRRGTVALALVVVIGQQIVEETREFHHRPTPPFPRRRRATSARATRTCIRVRSAPGDRRVDVDLGPVRWSRSTTAQDVGKAINPLSVVGQIQGGTTQGIGLALMEEIQLRDGVIRNPSFTDYLIPTILDTPPIQCRSSSSATRPRRRASRCRRTADDLLDPGRGVRLARRVRAAVDALPVRPEHITGG